MLAEFYIPRLSNDMKLVVLKNQLGGQIWYEVCTALKNGVLDRKPMSSGVTRWSA